MIEDRADHRAAPSGRRREDRPKLAALALLGATMASAVGAESSAEFAERAARVIEARFPERQCRIDAPAAVVCGDVTLGLENLRRTIAETGAEDDVIDAMIIQFFGLAMVEAMQDQQAHRADSKGRAQGTSETAGWDSAERLRLQLVPVDYRKQLGKKNVESFLPGILVAVAVDHPDRYEFMLDRHLEAWPATREEARARALRNLARISEGLALEADRPGNPELPGKWLAISEKDGYAAARILVPAVRARIAELLGETFFFALPNRDFLVAWSRDFAHHLDFMSRVKQDFESRTHPLSPEIFIGSATEVREATAAELTSAVQFDWGED